MYIAESSNALERYFPLVPTTIRRSTHWTIFNTRLFFLFVSCNRFSHDGTSCGIFIYLFIFIVRTLQVEKKKVAIYLQTWQLAVSLTDKLCTLVLLYRYTISPWAPVHWRWEQTQTSNKRREGVHNQRIFLL